MEEKWVKQTKFCSAEKLSVKTFAYWLRKYKQYKGFSAKKNESVQKVFIPVEVSSARNHLVPDCGRIEVIFPNGVHINCPVGIDIAPPASRLQKRVSSPFFETTVSNNLNVFPFKVNLSVDHYFLTTNTDLTIKCRIPSFHSVYSFIVASAFTNKLLSSRNAAFINQIGIKCHIPFPF